MKAAAAVLMLAVSILAAQDPKKKPVPDDAALKEAERLTREVFREEYAGSSAPDRKALALKLLEQGREAGDDAPTQYVLFREAKDLALQAGDPETALLAVQEMDAVFDIDASEMRIAIVSAGERKAKTPEELKALTEELLKLADEAVEEDNYEAASRALSAAGRTAKKSRDAALAERADAKAKEVSELKSKYETIRKAREKLAANPDDAAAGLIVGRFLCFVKGDWEGGLPLLARCSDEALKALAAKDLAAPQEAREQAEVGDGWWNMSEKEGGIAKDVVRRRAAYWYRQAVKGLTGLAKTKVEKRLGELRTEKSGGWEELDDPAMFGEKGKRGDPIELEAQWNNARGALLKKFPQGDFDGVSVRLRFVQGVPNACGALVLDRSDFAAALIPSQRAVTVNRGAGGRWALGERAEIPAKEEYVLEVIVQDGEYIVSVDGKERLRAKTRATAITDLLLQAQWGKVTFDRIKLRHR